LVGEARRKNRNEKKVGYVPLGVWKKEVKKTKKGGREGDHGGNQGKNTR